MNSEISQELIQFISDLMGIPEKDITPDARLFEDLGIYGADTSDLILAFSKKFNVDLSNFRAGDYIGAEGVDFITPIINLFTGKKTVQLKTLRIKNLQLAIEAGKLDEHIITQSSGGA